MTPLSLYVHIPFCKRKCPYCHFYVIPDREDHKQALLNALLTEWKLRLSQAGQHEIISIYFGGGTPSLLDPRAIGNLLETIRKEAHVSDACEITLETNPDEVTPERIARYAQAGVNRVSMGVQSLSDASLQVLERTHTAKRAIEAIWQTADAGIGNLSIDLMYELPDQTVESFEQTLVQLDRLPITHLSLYNLTIEPHTPFAKRTLRLPDQEAGLAMLQLASRQLTQIGLKRYEISAFCHPGFRSRHNVGYWTGRPFFGLGPSAFSYYEGSRLRNVAHLRKYCSALEKGRLPIDFSETLPYPRNVHEQLAIGLRLLDGVVPTLFDRSEQACAAVDRLTIEGFLVREKGRVKLTEKGLLFYDSVAAEII